MQRMVRRLTNMKILNEGNKQVAHWWHGVVLTCPTCGRKVELEAQDCHSMYWMHADPHGVSVACEMCSDTMHAKSPNDPSSATAADSDGGAQKGASNVQ